MNQCTDPLNSIEPVLDFDRSQKQTVTLLRHLETVFQGHVSFGVAYGKSENKERAQKDFSTSLKDLRKDLIRLFFMAMTPWRQSESLENAYFELFNEPVSKVFSRKEGSLSAVIEQLHWTCSLFGLTPSHLGAIYEMLLLEEKRKKAGSYYTPYPLAKAMAETLCFYLALNSKKDTACSILDPAVGGGVFLQALSDVQCQESQNDVQKSVFYGWDLEGDIIEATRLSLWWEAGCPGQFRDFMAHALVQRDALITANRGAEGEEAPLFDALIGNPPYLSVKQGIDPEQREAYESQYECAQGQYDLYALFIERGLQLLKPHGLLVYLLPKPLLVNDQQRPIREIMLKHNILEIWDVGKDAFIPKAAVESAVIVLEKLPEGVLPKSEHCFKRIHFKGVQGQGERLKKPVETGKIKQAVLGAFPEKNLNLWLTPENVAFLKTVEAHSIPFKDWLESSLSSSLSLPSLPSFQGRGMEMGKNHCRRRPKEGFLPVLTGQEVTAFRLPQPPGFYALFDESDTKYHKPRALYKSPKLIVRRVAHRPIAVVDDDECLLTLNTLYNFHLKDPTLYPVACVLMNSERLARWFKERFYFSEQLFPYLRQQQILALPMPTLKALRQEVPESLLSPMGLLIGLESLEPKPNTMTYQDLLTRLYHALKKATKENEKSLNSLYESLNGVIDHLYGLV